VTEDNTHQHTLRRVVKLPYLVLYGLGTILGAGIYILISKVAFHANIYTPLSFLVAGLVVAFTAFVYAELSGRFPKSAGEATYVANAYGKPGITFIIGMLIAATGIVSSATIISGFTGYFNEFFEVNPDFAEAVLIIILAFIAFWGISESVKIASVMTVIEVIGLLLVIAVSLDDISFDIVKQTELDLNLSVWAGIFTGAFLAFYAFIGFEDMVNIAEEVVEPEKNMPKGIIIVLIVSTVFYMLVAFVAVFAMPLDKLLGSTAPFSDIVRTNSNVPVSIITSISLFAVVNGALIQIIMASRLLYGMSRHKVLPKFLNSIHPVTRVPHKATFVVAACILILTLTFELESLANLTSYIVVIMFITMNLTLITIKRREASQSEKYQGFTIPMAVPVTGLIVLFGFLLSQLL